MTITFKNGEKLTATPSMLNHIACALLDAQEYNLEHHYDATAELNYEEFRIIHDAVKNSGYYARDKKEDVAP